MGVREFINDAKLMHKAWKENNTTTCYATAAYFRGSHVAETRPGLALSDLRDAVANHMLAHAGDADGQLWGLHGLVALSSQLQRGVACAASDATAAITAAICAWRGFASGSDGLFPPSGFNAVGQRVSSVILGILSPAAGVSPASVIRPGPRALAASGGVFPLEIRPETLVRAARQALLLTDDPSLADLHSAVIMSLVKANWCGCGVPPARGLSHCGGRPMRLLLLQPLCHRRHARTTTQLDCRTLTCPPSVILTDGETCRSRPFLSSPFPPRSPQRRRRRRRRSSLSPDFPPPYGWVKEKKATTSSTTTGSINSAAPNADEDVAYRLSAPLTWIRMHGSMSVAGSGGLRLTVEALAAVPAACQALGLAGARPAAAEENSATRDVLLLPFIEDSRFAPAAAMLEVRLRASSPSSQLRSSCRRLSVAAPLCSLPHLRYLAVPLPHALPAQH